MPLSLLEPSAAAPAGTGDWKHWVGGDSRGTRSQQCLWVLEGSLWKGWAGPGSPPAHTAAALHLCAAPPLLSKYFS